MEAKVRKAQAIDLGLFEMVSCRGWPNGCQSEAQKVDIERKKVSY